MKTSGELFILCSGPSLNDLNDAQWNQIHKGDSVGINFSYLNGRRTTYHIFSFEPDQLVLGTMKETIKECPSLNDTTILLPTKALARLAHPRICPELFPERAKYLLFKLPKTMYLERDRDFLEEDFDQSLFYRGTTSLAIELGVNVLGYKRIIIVGSDLQTICHFYDKYPVMKSMVERRNSRHASNAQIGSRRYTGKFGTMVPQGNKFKTFDVYLSALREYLFTRRRVQLFVDFPDELLPQIPAYF